MVVGSTSGPVGEFCAALSELQRSSGLSRGTLAHTLNYGRSQLYEILDGRIKRPPEWDRMVEPFVRVCLNGSLGAAAREAAVADWRRRHEVLVRVYDELARRETLPVVPRGGGSRSLLAYTSALWRELIAHPFVRAVADGTLDDAAFRRWMVNDHYYNLEYGRYIAGLAQIAPTATATELIASAVPGSRTGLDEIRRIAARFAIDLGGEPALVTVGLASFLQAQVSRGYAPALTAIYAAEKVYFDAWSSVRAVVDRSAPYWDVIDHFSSPECGQWVASLGNLVDAVPGGIGPECHLVFDRLVRFELLFFDAMRSGETW